MSFSKVCTSADSLWSLVTHYCTGQSSVTSDSKIYLNIRQLFFIHFSLDTVKHCVQWPCCPCCTEQRFLLVCVLTVLVLFMCACCTLQTSSIRSQCRHLLPWTRGGACTAPAPPLPVVPHSSRDCELFSVSSSFSCRTQRPEILHPPHSLALRRVKCISRPRQCQICSSANKMIPNNRVSSP